MTKMTFNIFVNFLKTFNGSSEVLILIVEDSETDEPVISQTIAGILSRWKWQKWHFPFLSIFSKLLAGKV